LNAEDRGGWATRAKWCLRRAWLGLDLSGARRRRRLGLEDMRLFTAASSEREHNEGRKNGGTRGASYR
jgi:hypothetical protein